MLNEHHTVVTPENVELRHEVAGVGSRLTAATLDYIILTIGQILLFAGSTFAAGFLRDLGALEWLDRRALGNLILALTLVLVFGGWWGYYVLFELLWNGQTPGKRLLGLRVMGRQAQRVGGFASVVRNMLRPVDQFLLIGLLVMFIDGQSRRLGDFAAGTLVIRDPRVPKGGLPSPTAVTGPAGGVDALTAGGFSAGRMTAADYALLREFFERRKRMGDRQADALAGQVARAFANRLEVAIPAGMMESQFLSALAAAYEARNQYRDTSDL